MKILVDKMPENANDCIFAISWLTKHCELSKDQNFECNVGQEGVSSCPFLREFEACTERPLRPGGSAFERIPVKLMED